MSLTGTPLINTATFSELKPRTLILPSPNPPPSLVANIPGVDFNTSGNSWLPILASICFAEIVETATGVLRLVATEAITLISERPIALLLQVILPMLASCPLMTSVAISCVS